MKRSWLVMVVALVVGACAAPPPRLLPSPASDTAPAGGAAAPVAIRLGFSSEPDMGDVPALMALELLQAGGYSTTAEFFTQTELSAAALAQGEVDFGAGSTRTSWTAAGREGEIATLMEQLANEWTLVSAPGIRVCGDLEGKHVAITSSGSLTKALLDAYIELNCPDTEYQAVFIGGSANRAAALLSGEIDATLLELGDMLRIEGEAPERFHTLASMAEAFPSLKTTGLYVNRRFAASHDQAVHDFLRAILTVHRRIAEDPGLLAEAAERHLNLEPEEAAWLAAAYVGADLWDPNGGLDIEAVASSLKFFADMGSVPVDVTVAQVAELSYLDQVLEEIGRR